MTSQDRPNLADICNSHQLHTKWLLCPSHRVGHQWIECLVRSGQAVVNLHPATTLRLALDLVGSELADEGLTLANRSIGTLVIDATWSQLRSDGYLGRLEQSAELSASACLCYGTSSLNSGNSRNTSRSGSDFR